MRLLAWRSFDPIGGAGRLYRGVISGVMVVLWILGLALGTPDAQAQWSPPDTARPPSPLTQDPGAEPGVLSAGGHIADEVVVTGSMRAVRLAESVVPVEVVTPGFFRRSPQPSLPEALARVAGIQPLAVCGVCHTVELRMMGLEGPYTMIMVDGVPLYQPLGSVYGLQGIAQGVIDRVEIVRGPGSALYGSEALAGVVNVITLDPARGPRRVMAEAWGSSHGEVYAEAGGTARIGRVPLLVSATGYLNALEYDWNGDGHRDLPHQQRLSLLAKARLPMGGGRPAGMILGRIYGEGRWAGQLGYTPAERGTDTRYGETIFTRRAELIGALPVASLPGGPLWADVGYVHHHQNSWYGQSHLEAREQTVFGQLRHDFDLTPRHRVLVALPLRGRLYIDNTAVSRRPPTTEPGHSPVDTSRFYRRDRWMPGLLMQDEFRASDRLTLLAGGRLDYDMAHGLVATPRAGARWQLPHGQGVRLNVGSGYRVAEVFTEDHQALSGARRPVFAAALRPERSWNATATHTGHIDLPGQAGFISTEVSLFATYFRQRVIADYDEDPRLIVYRNLDGHAWVRGAMAQVIWQDASGQRARLGLTALESFWQEGHGGAASSERAFQVPGLQAVADYSHPLPGRAGAHWALDLTGVVTSPMRLPLQERDPRPDMSPWWGTLNVQVRYQPPGRRGLGAATGSLEWFAGVRNALNLRPPSPLARPDDPFDRRVLFDAAGQPVPTADNPHALTFDTGYSFAPMQPLRVYAGLRF